MRQFLTRSCFETAAVVSGKAQAETGGSGNFRTAQCFERSIEKSPCYLPLLSKICMIKV
jgi:hypothetical protein